MTQELQNQLEIILNTVLSIFQIVATFLAAFLVVLWLTLCFWTFRDIQARTRDIIAQIMATMLVFFFNIPGVFLYMLVRPKETLNQAYERSLQEEYMLQDLEEREICATCRVKTQPDFLFCFNCRTRLRRECTSCNQLVKIKWASCPFCGSPQKSKIRETITTPTLPRTTTSNQPRVAAASTTQTALTTSASTNTSATKTATLVADLEEEEISPPSPAVTYYPSNAADAGEDVATSEIELTPEQRYQSSRQRRQKNDAEAD